MQNQSAPLEKTVSALDEYACAVIATLEEMREKQLPHRARIELIKSIHAAFFDAPDLKSSHEL